jgi:hypothetical protein
MMRRRMMLKRGAEVAAALAAAGLWPAGAHAAWAQQAFDAKGFAEALKALGARRRRRARTSR